MVALLRNYCANYCVNSDSISLNISNSRGALRPPRRRRGAVADVEGDAAAIDAIVGAIVDAILDAIVAQ